MAVKVYKLWKRTAVIVNNVGFKYLDEVNFTKFIKENKQCHSVACIFINLLHFTFQHYRTLLNYYSIFLKFSSSIPFQIWT